MKATQMRDILKSASFASAHNQHGDAIEKILAVLDAIVADRVKHEARADVQRQIDEARFLQ
jgi:hypothetical protein